MKLLSIFALALSITVAEAQINFGGGATINSGKSSNKGRSSLSKQSKKHILSRDEVINFFKRDGSKAQHYLGRHIRRDSDKCLVDPNVVFDFNLKGQEGLSRLTIKGSIRYVELYPGKYNYDLIFNNDGTITTEVRIHFKGHKNINTQTIRAMQSKLDAAADKWERNNQFIPNLNFRFLVVGSKKEAHFAVKLKQEFTRGPYMRNWSESWSDTTVAHEIGHMLGLDDEYSNNPMGGSTSKCDRNSIMCSSWGGSPNRYQYYLIARRVFCH